MRFSICIPNFNYGGYIGETINSVLQQDYTDFEVLLSDNKSTDNSWEVIQGFAQKDNRVKATQNTTNLGFAGNLDPASKNATGDYMILLSSDDLINPGALSFYKKIIDKVGHTPSVFCTTWDVIDSNGKKTGTGGPRKEIWNEKDIDAELTKQLGHPVYKLPAKELLKRCLKTYSGPFNFAPTCYRAEDYIKVGGYGGSRMMNPDKWFHLRLLGVVEYAYFIDYSYFSYRWHQNNQTAQQKKSGALKYFVDEYRTSFEIDKKLLDAVGFSQNDLTNSFIHNVIHKNVFRQIADGNPMYAFRLLCLGFAAYPEIMFKKGLSYVLFLLTILGPVGRLILKITGKK